MRKRTVRKGIRVVLVALIIIIIASFYHSRVSEILSLPYAVETRFYQFEILMAAAMGSYGVVLSVFGLVLPATNNDSGVRIMPSLLLIIGVMYLFFHLLAASVFTPFEPSRDRVRPGETITI